MGRLIRYLTRNLDLKVAAILLAAVTWYYVATAGIDERRFAAVPVRVVNLPQDVALLSLDVRKATVILKGPRRDLDTLKTSELFAVVDLRDVSLSKGEPQSPRIPLESANIRVGRDPESAERLPPGVRLLRSEPEAISLTLDRVNEVVLNVEVVTEGEPAPGFTLKKTAVQTKAKVRGAFRLLQRLTAIRTEPIRVDGLSERLRRRVPLQREVVSPDYGTVPIYPEPAMVDVILDVVETPDEKTIERVPVRLATLPKTLAVIKEEVREVAVRLSGPQRLLRDIDAADLVAEINLEGTQPPARGNDVTTVFLRRENIRQMTGAGTTAPLEAGIELIEVRPKTVLLTLDRVATRSLTVNVVCEGAPAEDYELGQVAAIPDTISVRGPESVLEGMKSIDTFPVLVTGVTERLRRSVRLVDTVDVGVFRGVRVEPARQSVDVVIAVTERRQEKTLTGLPVHLVLRSSEERRRAREMGIV